jgi:ribosomal protein L16/L10AE
MFVPKKTSFLKFHKKRVKNSPSSGVYFAYGKYGLKVKQNGVLTTKQLEMLKFHLARGTKKLGHY